MRIGRNLPKSFYRIGQPAPSPEAASPAGASAHVESRTGAGDAGAQGAVSPLG